MRQAGKVSFMGRGPRRERVKFRESPQGARTREFVRRDEADPVNMRNRDGQPMRTLENRRNWQEASERLAVWFSDLHPAAQKRLTAFVIRCPMRGCLLGRVFRQGDPKARIQYVWLARAHAGQNSAAIVNWAWDGGRGSKEFMTTSCRHGTARIDIGLLQGMIEALDFPPSSPTQGWLNHYEMAIQRGYARRTIVASDADWTART